MSSQSALYDSGFSSGRSAIRLGNPPESIDVPSSEEFRRWSVAMRLNPSPTSFALCQFLRGHFSVRALLRLQPPSRPPRNCVRSPERPMLDYRHVAAAFFKDKELQNRIAVKRQIYHYQFRGQSFFLWISSLCSLIYE